MKLRFDGHLLTTAVTVCYHGITFKAEGTEIDVGMLPKSHPGLLGLDILKTYGFIMDMDKLELYRAGTY